MMPKRRGADLMECPRRRPLLRLAAFALALAGAQWAWAQSLPSPFGGPNRFKAQDGEAIYRTICQGCHMAEGQGAAGAGRYPALARNERLGVPGYVVAVVSNGMRAMPPFASKSAPWGC